MTVAEVTWLLLIVGATTVGTLLVAGWHLHWQERDIRDLRADLEALEEAHDELRAWCMAAAVALGWDDDDPGGEDPDPEPDPDDDGPDTVIAHPADTWARKAALLSRYTHSGQHRG